MPVILQFQNVLQIFCRWLAIFIRNISPRSVLLLSVLVWLSSCKLSDKEKTSIPVDPDLKNTFSFKEGSYWIFRDSISGEQDSLTPNSFRFLTQVAIGGKYYDQISMDFDGVHRGFGITMTDKTLDFAYADRARYSYPIDPLVVYPLNSNILGNIVKFDNLAIANQNFSDVYEVISPADSISEYNRVYLSREIGFVKAYVHRSLYHDRRAWELIRYNIIK